MKHNEKKRKESNQKFINYIEQHGGLLTLKQVLKTTKLSISQIDRGVRERKFIEIRFDNKSHYPAFQFDKALNQAAFTVVLSAIPEHIGSVHTCCFFLNPMSGLKDGVDDISPFEVLCNTPAPEHTMLLLEREARNLGSMGT